ncbi:hypothetical protein [Verrucomicrobium sp. BvORR106]|uniref:hypothetical protein n=1 Tax=Verrucomicrobium sp. BvORR106 TaxID=1403819 RepID=UPI00056F8290|nr:hypothetical protein [Verrucomicrobium sp. BvORR106]
MKEIIVTKVIFDIYNKYDGDFGLLDERWASEGDRRKVTLQQTMIFSEYMDKLRWLKVRAISAELRAAMEARLMELEDCIENEVAEEVRRRVQQESP